MIERYLADENLPAPLIRRLRDGGLDVLSVGLDFAGIADEDVLRLARADGRVLLTFDRDFGELVFKRRLTPAPGVVLFRLEQRPLEPLMALVEAFFAAKLPLMGHFTVVSETHVRQVPIGMPPT